MTRRSVVTFLILLCAAAATGCDRSGASGQPPRALPAAAPARSAAAPSERYVMVLFLRGSEFFSWACAGMRDAATRLGPNIHVEVQGPVEWDGPAEVRTLDALLATPPDGVLVTAADADALLPAINRAVATGIPVVTFDSDVPASHRSLFVGTDNYVAGYEAGRAMADWLDDRGEVGIATHDGPDHLKRRLQGFQDAMAQFGSGITIAGVVDDEGDTSVSEERITALLTEHPGIRGVFATHALPSSGVAAAVRKLGLRNKVQIMGFDFGTPVIDLVERGELRATVGQNPYLMGYMGLIALHAARHRQPLPKRPLPGNSPNDFFVPPLLPIQTNGTIDTGVSILTKPDMWRYKRVPNLSAPN